MGKKRILTNASSEAMRWGQMEEGGPEIEPGAEGNFFDVQMQEEIDGLAAAKKVVKLLKGRGVCIVEANAPQDLLSTAFDEAEALWAAGAFGPPVKVYDQDSQFEAQLWQSVLYQDEQKVIWCKQEESRRHQMDSLMLLSQNMMDFARGLGDVLAQETGIGFSHIWNAMISCYTGDRTYNLHIDNPHGADGALPDNGLRLSLCYYINPHWDPDDGSNAGGLDVYLTDPRETPTSAGAARKARKMRIAPHADTLALFLAERMAHQVVPTTKKDRWFCLWMWCFDESAMTQFVAKTSEMSRKAQTGSDSD